MSILRIQQWIDADNDLNETLGSQTLLMSESGIHEKAECAIILIEAGTDIVVARQPGGERALHTASMKDLPSVVEKLIEFGADMEAKTNYGWTPWKTALYYNASASALILISKGCPIDRYPKNLFHGVKLRLACQNLLILLEKAKAVFKNMDFGAVEVQLIVDFLCKEESLKKVQYF